MAGDRFVAVGPEPRHDGEARRDLSPRRPLHHHGGGEGQRRDVGAGTALRRAGLASCRTVPPMSSSGQGRARSGVRPAGDGLDAGRPGLRRMPGHRPPRLRRRLRPVRRVGSAQGPVRPRRRQVASAACAAGAAEAAAAPAAARASSAAFAACARAVRLQRLRRQGPPRRPVPRPAEGPAAACAASSRARPTACSACPPAICAKLTPQGPDQVLRRPRRTRPADPRLRPLRRLHPIAPRLLRVPAVLRPDALMTSPATIRDPRAEPMSSSSFAKNPLRSGLRGCRSDRSCLE